MSQPANFLSKFRTYSYHHILIACDNEAAAERIRHSNSLSTFRELNVSQGVFIEDSTQNLTEIDGNNETSGRPDDGRVGSYVVILNGIIDTRYVVKDVNWFTTTAASTSAHDKFTSLAVEGSMTIEEPRGVNFLNDLNGACDLLRSDPSGVIWMLKTIFIGYRDTNLSDSFSDSDGQVEYLTELLPLEFMMYDVTGTFDVTGGTYELFFAGTSNGAARFPQFSQVAQTISVSVRPTLALTLESLEGKMIRNSRNNRRCVIDKLKETYKEYSETDLEQFREVQYRIIAEPPYDDPKYVIDGLNDRQKEKAVKGFSQGVIKFGPKVTVEQAIRFIMEKCDQVAKDRTEGDPFPTLTAGQKYSWKIHTDIEMITDAGSIDGRNTQQDIVLVTYHVRRHAELTNKTIESVLQGDDVAGETNDEVTKKRIEDNLITFDYFFTGKNIDIINFDLKMEMGLAHLQAISSTNTIGTGTSELGGYVHKESNVKIVPGTENNRGEGETATDGETEKKIITRSRTPIFPATNMNNVFQKNTRGALNSTLYQAMLSRHAALESVEATLTIAGNPFLMSQTNRKQKDISKKNESDPNDPSRIMQHTEFMPALAKVNIFMPTNSDTPSSTDTFRRQRFWYDGYYYIYGIDHKFADGLFTQDLHMLSLPNESLLLERQQNDISACGEEAPKAGKRGNKAQTETGAVDDGETEPNVDQGNTNVIAPTILGVRGDGVT